MMESYNKPVDLADILVNPGDLIMADQSGVLVIPLNKAKEVLALAREIAAAEDNIVASIQKGLTLKEARVRFNYDALQRAKD
jgi:4-hydroxy-4-methyl-2-oxoglutarate aldolase